MFHGDHCWIGAIIRVGGTDAHYRQADQTSIMVLRLQKPSPRHQGYQLIYNYTGDKIV
jgi:hypothetical protein